MLRITELKLPIDHPDEDLRAALLQRLGFEPVAEFDTYTRFHCATPEKQ